MIYFIKWQLVIWLSTSWFFFNFLLKRREEEDGAQRGCLNSGVNQDFHRYEMDISMENYILNKPQCPTYIKVYTYVVWWVYHIHFTLMISHFNILRKQRLNPRTKSGYPSHLIKFYQLINWIMDWLLALTPMHWTWKELINFPAVPISNITYHDRSCGSWESQQSPISSRQQKNRKIEANHKTRRE